jgi:hypothetical protein
MRGSTAAGAKGPAAWTGAAAPCNSTVEPNKVTRTRGGDLYFAKYLGRANMKGAYSCAGRARRAEEGVEVHVFEVGPQRPRQSTLSLGRSQRRHLNNNGSHLKAQAIPPVRRSQRSRE